MNKSVKFISFPKNKYNYYQALKIMADFKIPTNLVIKNKKSTVFRLSYPVQLEHAIEAIKKYDLKYNKLSLEF